MGIGTEIRNANEDAARRVLGVMVERARKQVEQDARKSYIGTVQNTIGPVIRIAGHNYERTSYRVAKGVSLNNLVVGDEVLMVQSSNSIFVLTQIIRVSGDESDDIDIQGTITATTLSSDFVITSNLVVNGPISGAGANFTNDVEIAGNLDITGGGTLTCDALTVGELTVTTKVGFFGTAPILARPDYTVTNKTVQRTLNANDETLDEVLDILGTLISDLQDYGLLRGTHN